MNADQKWRKQAVPLFRLVEGAEYVYTSASPTACQGHRYRLLRLVLEVPLYRWNVLVEALTGPDAGLWFVCSQANFAQHYQPAEVPLVPTMWAADAGESPPDPPPEERAAGYVTGGGRT